MRTALFILGAAMSGVVCSSPVHANPMLPVPEGPEFMVSTDEAFNKDQSAVAAHPDGRMVVAWSSSGQDGHGLGIFAQRYGADGQPAGTEFQVNTQTAFHQAYPKIAYSANGSFVIVWQSDRQDGSGWGIYGQRYDADGNVAGSEFLVNEITQGNQEWPAVGIDASGNFVVVWERSMPDAGWGYFARQFAANGTALGGEFQVNSESQFNQAQPASVAFLPDGGFLIVWSGRFGSLTDRRIYARRYNQSGEPMAVEQPYSAPSEDQQLRPAIALNPSGQGLVAWHKTSADSPFTRSIQARRLDQQGQVVGPQFQVNQHDKNNHENAGTAIDAAGNALVTWAGIRQDSTPWDIYARYLPKNGNLCLPEFRVNTTTSNDQFRPAVGMAGDGRALVTWHSTPPDRERILGQRYAPPDGIFQDRFEACL